MASVSTSTIQLMGDTPSEKIEDNDDKGDEKEEEGNGVDIQISTSLEAPQDERNDEGGKVIREILIGDKGKIMNSIFLYVHLYVAELSSFRWRGR